MIRFFDSWPSWSRAGVFRFARKQRTFGELKPLRRTAAFIVGNGPSLLRHDLNLLGNFPTFASNGIYLAFDKTEWRPTYYSCVDTAVLPDQRVEINACIRKLKRTSFIFPHTIITHENPREPTPVSSFIESSRNVFFYEPYPLDIERAAAETFNIDPTSDRIVDPMSVTIALMQMAVKLGAQKLFLIGCDTTYIVPPGAQILDQASPRVDKRIILSDDCDPNHFDPRYFGKGRVWHTPNTDFMIKHYEKAREVCASIGVEVYNAGIGGALEVFPRIDFEDALANAR